MKTILVPQEYIVAGRTSFQEIRMNRTGSLRFIVSHPADFRIEIRVSPSGTGPKVRIPDPFKSERPRVINVLSDLVNGDIVYADITPMRPFREGESLIAIDQVGL